MRDVKRWLLITTPLLVITIILAEDLGTRISLAALTAAFVYISYDLVSLSAVREGIIIALREAEQRTQEADHTSSD